jgi:hypothetical protein
MDLVEQIERMEWELSQKDPERHAEIAATYEDILAKLHTNKPVYLTESERPIEEVDGEVLLRRRMKLAFLRKVSWFRLLGIRSTQG